MATSPLRSFTDLSAYQAAAAQPSANPLDALIQGFAQGQQIQQLPQVQAEQALTRQLQNALALRKLQDLQNPQAAMERELAQRFEEELIKSSFDPLSGVRRAGVGAPPVGEIEPIFNTITGKETPFVRDLELRRSNLAKAAGPEKPIQIRNTVLERNQLTGRLEPVFTAEESPSVKAANVKQFADAQGNLFTQPVTGGAVQPVLDANGQQINVGVRRAGASSTGGATADLKPTGEAVNQFGQGLGVLGQINETLKVVEDIKKEGKFPNAFQVGLDEFLGRRPQDIPGAGTIPGLGSAYATIQNLAKGIQTKEAASIQRKKAVIGATIIRAQAGLSQTLGEAINISPYTPSPSDDYETLVAKLNDLRTEGQRALKIQRRLFPQLAAISAPELGEQSPQSAAPSGGRSFNSEEEARAAGFQDGDTVIINNVAGQLTP